MCENLTVVQRQVHVNLDCNLQLTEAETNLTMSLPNKRTTLHKTNVTVITGCHKLYSSMDHCHIHGHCNSYARHFLPWQETFSPGGRNSGSMIDCDIANSWYRTHVCDAHFL